jgi:hypothetical protein
MENDKLINTCKKLLEYTINGFIIDDQVVFGLFSDTDVSISELSVSDIDITIIKIAIVLFCINNNNISINTDGDIEIDNINKMLTSTKYGGTKKIRDVSAIVRSFNTEVHIPTTHVRANKSVYMIYRFLFILISILSIATGLRSLFYLYQNTFEAKWLIMSQSVDKLISLSDNYPSKDVVEDVEHLFELINEYNNKSRDTDKPSETITDIALIESFTMKIANLKGSQLSIPLQLDMPDDNIDTLTLMDFNKPIISILHIYRYYMNYFFKLRQSKLEELLYNNQVYIEVENYFNEKNKLFEEVNEIFNKFKEQVTKDTEQFNKTSYGEVFLNTFTNLFSNEPSTLDIARSKISLLNAMINKWSNIMIKAPTEMSNAITSTSGFITNITNIVNLVQEQILVSCVIYSFFQFIIYLIYQKFIHKKISTDHWNQIKEDFKPIVEESVKIYFTNFNVDKNDDALNALTHIFIDLFHSKITDPTSGLINYGTTPEETIQLNKQEIQEYILSCIDILIKNHSLRNDIIHNMIISYFKPQQHSFTNEELAPVYKLMTIYIEKEYDEDKSDVFMIENGTEKSKIDGGKKNNKKSRKTRTIKTRRHKRSKTYKRTRRYKRFKMNRRTRRIRSKK